MKIVNKPIKNVTGIHWKQRLFKVRTYAHPSLSENEVTKKLGIAEAVRYAAVDIMEVRSIRANDSETALFIDGLLIKVDGTPLHTGADASKGVVSTEIVLDQENVSVQPGTWFDFEEDAQTMAADINSKAVTAIRTIINQLEKAEESGLELVEKGA